MAYVHSALTARDILTAEQKSGLKTERKPGLLRRLIVAMQDARLRQAEREIALYLSRSGGKFTDESEREIERRFLSHRN
ncbi:MAG TPA: hypothetical protein VIJ67_04550 [Pseudolabrys sp.]|jgi:hypothetical protein